MIWLSPMAGTAESSMYFEIRDVKLRRTAHGNEGLIRGLLGDGRQELWSEIQLGPDAHVAILPQWNENGDIEFFNEVIDVDLLKSQLLSEVVDAIAALDSCYPENKGLVTSPHVSESQATYVDMAA